MQQKIIRDCDMMSFTEDSHLYSVIFGLQNEFKIDMVSDQIKNQISFMLNLEFNTEWAKSIFESKYGYLMSDLNIIQNIFKDDIYTKEVEMLEMYENEK